MLARGAPRVDQSQEGFLPGTSAKIDMARKRTTGRLRAFRAVPKHRGWGQQLLRTVKQPASPAVSGPAAASEREESPFDMPRALAAFSWRLPGARAPSLRDPQGG